MPKATAPKTSATPDLPEPDNYESALQELEGLVARIESSQLPLGDMLAAYQRGAVLLAFCRGKLEAVQDQIKVLDEGQLKPWTSEE
ncbi:exodeoxyribonuclease VII small subunit [Comamonas sp.]|uniref:exodeoxyribonuclease VII small subunit n=1 Tax=Comamonas sp. TaxID=34028 RepID=UPI0028A25DEA|nr:exodeoxyribonuclease VII small subunit [Comamonas sp.]